MITTLIGPTLGALFLPHTLSLYLTLTLSHSQVRVCVLAARASAPRFTQGPAAPPGRQRQGHQARGLTRQGKRQI